jgi:probable rRNA maturation factor
MTPVVDISVTTKEWAQLEDIPGLAEEAILAASRESGTALHPNCEVSILLCNDALIAKLNQQWRGIAKPTNVLSFPAARAAHDMPEPAPLGDIVIAFETAAKEAAEAQIPLREHVAHLLVHGFLHLAGYDHAAAKEAEAMEEIERAALGKLGIANPYAARLIEVKACANERA